MSPRIIESVTAKAAALYSAPGRYYHTLRHAHHVANVALDLFDRNVKTWVTRRVHPQELANLRISLQVAAMAHDVMQGKEHECASAAWLLGVSDSLLDAAWLIIAGTAHRHGSFEERKAIADRFLFAAHGRSPNYSKELELAARCLHDADLIHFVTNTSQDIVDDARSIMLEHTFEGMKLADYIEGRERFLRGVSEAASDGTLFDLLSTRTTRDGVEADKRRCAVFDTLSVERDWLRAVQAFPKIP